MRKSASADFFYLLVDIKVHSGIHYWPSTTEEATMYNVIYKIINIQNQKFYVGSSTNFAERSRTHRQKLRQGTHHCAHLQAAWNKYGESNFVFAIVQQLGSAAELQPAEDIWLSEWVGKPECYNVGTRSGAPMRGRTGDKHPSFGKVVSAEQKAAISKTLQRYYAMAPENHPRFGKHLSEQSRAQISKNRKGKMAGDSHYRFGETVSAEVRKKIGDAQRGKSKAPRVLTVGGREKIAAAAEAGHYASFKGKQHSAASRKLMGDGIIVMPSGRRFDTITEMREALGVPIATVHRSLRSNKPIALGAHKGLSFQYQDPEREAARLAAVVDKPKQKLGRPAGQVNERQLQPVRTVPEGKTYSSVMEFVRQNGVPRSAAYKMLEGKERDGMTLVRV
jgi:group I intron endonuclease